jgi:hypothetical protein
MTEKEFDPKSAVYTPPEVATYTLDAIKEVKELKTRGIALPIADIKDYFAPLLPGQICVVQAQTHQYKSGFLHFWENAAALQLMEDGRDDEAIIHVSVEEVVEEQGFLMLGRMTGEDAGKLARGEVQDWSRLEAEAQRIGTIPIYRIGDSLARAEDMPNLYLSNMVRAIRSLVDGSVTGRKIKPALLTFDYLQAFPIDPEIKKAQLENQRNLQVRQDFYRLYQAAAYFKCPTLVAVQAKQELEKRRGDSKMPGMYDAQETSAIAQRTQRMISLWMPKVTEGVGSQITIDNQTLTVTENMLFVKVAKQRGGLPSGQTWLCQIDFSKNLIAPLVTDKQSQPATQYPKGRQS